MAYVEAELAEILRMKQDEQIFNDRFQVEGLVEALGRNGFIAGNKIYEPEREYIVDKLEIKVCLQLISGMSNKQIMDNPDYIRIIAEEAMESILGIEKPDMISGL